jgi:hypothetical protein
VVLITLVLSACGGTHERGSAPDQAPQATPAATGPFPNDPQILARATTARQRRDLARLATDIEQIRAASAKVNRTSLKGTPGTRATTGRFLEDLDRSAIDDLSKNRIIDHAAAAVAGVCEQCFQQLEATRPIPAIAH